MKSFSFELVLALLTSTVCAAPTAKRATTNLKSWPPAAAASLDAMIKANANSSNYALFDMDNTSYQFDLTESLLPYLESKGVLTRNNLDPSLKLIPFKDTATYNETLFSYYYRLCDIDDIVCYPWIAQSFAGLSLRTLKGHVDDMIAGQKNITTTYYSGNNITNITVTPPRIFKGQVELYNELQRNGIDVYVITAANEEIVRMVAADPKYGYNVKPENVIGVSMLLKNSTGGLSTARLQVEEKSYNETANLDSIVTPYLWSPLTWYSGKWAATLEYIDQWKKPVLVAGDTPISDGYMIFHGVDVRKGGIHLWVNKRQRDLDAILKMQEENVKGQRENGLEVTADKNWVYVKPAEIRG